MSGSQKTETTKASRDPWAPAQGNLNSVLEAGRSYMGDPNQYTPTFSGNTQDAARMLGDLGRGQNTQQRVLPGMVDQYTSGVGDSLSALRASANGSMLGSNPYLDKVLNAANQRTADAVNRQFSAAGRFGPNASNTGVLADRIGATETNARMQNYEAERGRQLNAAGLLGQYGMQGANLAGQLDGANQSQIGLIGAGGAAQDAMDNARRTAGIDAATRVAGLTVPIAGLGGTQDSTTTTKTPTNWAGIATGLGSAALGGMTGGLGSAVGGGLGSMFGNFFGGGGGSSSQTGYANELPWAPQNAGQKYGGGWFS
jgi:hypothetical protein